MPAHRTHVPACLASGLQTDVPAVPTTSRHQLGTSTPVTAATSTPSGAHRNPVQSAGLLPAPTPRTFLAPALSRFNAAGRCRQCLHHGCTDLVCITGWSALTWRVCDTCQGTSRSDYSLAVANDDPEGACIDCDCTDGVRPAATLAVTA